MRFGTENFSFNKEVEELLEDMKNSVRRKPSRYITLVRVVWHCYFDPASPSQTHIARLMGMSDSLVSHYRNIFDDLIQGVPLTVDEFIAFNAYLGKRLSAIMAELRMESLTFKSDLNSRTLIKSVIRKAPGTNLLAIVDFLFRTTTVEETFKPLVADWRYEYFEALKQGRKWKARWISTHYRYSFIIAMSLSKVFSMLKQLRSVSK